MSRAAAAIRALRRARRVCLKRHPRGRRNLRSLAAKPALRGRAETTFLDVKQRLYLQPIAFHNVFVSHTPFVQF
jgi:hypothetical protein